MKHAAPRHQRSGPKPAARRAGPAPMRKAAMGRPYGLNHIAIGPVETGLEAQANQAANRVVRGERGVGHDLSAAPAASVAVPSRGNPLPQVHRAWLEPAFGADLGAVRVHHDADAATAARAEHAHAFTAGRDIYFGQDRYDPHVQEGRHLLAHEVAHVLQQTGESGSARRLHATDATGTGEVQRASTPRKREERIAAAPAAGPHMPAIVSPHGPDVSNAHPPETHAPAVAMSDAVHQATTQVPRPMSPRDVPSPASTSTPMAPRDLDISKARRRRPS